MKIDKGKRKTYIDCEETTHLFTATHKYHVIVTHKSCRIYIKCPKANAFI